MTAVLCPSCKKSVAWQDNEFRPFCSERCQLLDLGAWVEEEYRLPDGSQSVSEEDMEQIQRALAEREG
jgi:hypothetical protein